jgi:probable rRNA maturation factor
MISDEIIIQLYSSSKEIPPCQDFIKWAKVALEGEEAEITIRIVDEDESQILNQAYRKREGPTNVLSFSYTSDRSNRLEGDIVICAPLVSKEAKEQGKSSLAHFTHLTVHGILHLRGYDHVKEEDAKVMMEQEVIILSRFGISNPYK